MWDKANNSSKDPQLSCPPGKVREGFPARFRVVGRKGGSLFPCLFLLLSLRASFFLQAAVQDYHLPGTALRRENTTDKVPALVQLRAA